LSASEILKQAAQFRLPFERVSTVDELAHDPHAQARQMFPHIPQPGMGDIPVARQGMTLSAHDHQALRPAPAIGEHTLDVLQNWLGYTPAQLRELHEQGILTSEASAAETTQR
jgi:crotonobetainyl-CoA:carnitine CoA-transferase CaiB-like acyl-CoA transferase